MSRHRQSTHKTKSEKRQEDLQKVIQLMKEKKNKAIKEAEDIENRGCFASVVVFGVSIPLLGMLALFL